MNPVWNYAADFPIEEASGLDIKIEASIPIWYLSYPYINKMSLVAYLKACQNNVAQHGVPVQPSSPRRASTT